MKKVFSTVLNGLAAILPLALSLYLLYWLVTKTESLMSTIYLAVLPAGYYFPGLGTILAVIVLFLVGLLVQTFLIRFFLDLIEKLINRIPLIKSLYSSIKDFTQFISGSAEEEAQKAVSVSMPDGSRLIGLITAEKAGEKLFKGEDKKRIGVYLPMSYQMGGYTIYVERDRVEALDIGVEEAIRLCMTAGVASSGD